MIIDETPPAEKGPIAALGLGAWQNDNGPTTNVNTQKKDPMGFRQAKRCHIVKNTNTKRIKQPVFLKYLRLVL